MPFDFRSLVIDLSYEHPGLFSAVCKFKAALVELRTGVHFPYLACDFDFFRLVIWIFI